MSDEVWRPIPGFPDYAASSHGRIKRILPDSRGRVGGYIKPQCFRYAQVSLFFERHPYTMLVHRLVCLAFHGQPPSPRHVAAHGDGNGLNNRADNLRWATVRENEADKVLHGTSLAGRPSAVPPERRSRGKSHGRHTKPEQTARGERAGLSKLTEESVIAIRCDRRPRKQIAASYGVSVTMVGFIQRGISWTHVPMPPTFGSVP